MLRQGIVKIIKAGKKGEFMTKREKRPEVRSERQGDAVDRYEIATAS